MSRLISSDILPTLRLRRLRQHPGLQKLIRETVLNINDLILPLFIKHGTKIHLPIPSMPGCAQISLDYLSQEIQEIENLNIPAILLFGIPKYKDALGSSSYQPDGIIQKAIQCIKKLNSNLLIIADVCFCEYTDHGHCGILQEKERTGNIDNDATLEILIKQAVSYAQAGADVIAPSGMMDGMVKAIRYGLDQNNFQHIPILSYSTKYASSLYGPFRQAAEGPPQFGNRYSYQMDIANGKEALRETALDVEEGADMLMVKPASYYLDIIQNVKQSFPGIPLGAYQVSGEYAMIKAASQQGWIDEKKVVLEALTSIKRAGADFIISYYSKDVARWLKE